MRDESYLAAPLLPLGHVVPVPGLHGHEVPALWVLKYMLELKTDRYDLWLRQELKKFFRSDSWSLLALS